MELNEITKITGAKFINPVGKDTLPFPVIDRQRVNGTDYHELPNEDSKTNVVFGEKVLDRFDRLEFAKKELPESLIPQFRQLLTRDIAASKKQLTGRIQASKQPYGDEYKLGVNMFFRHAFGNETIRAEYTQLYKHHHEGVQRLYKAITGKMPSETGETKIQKSTDMLDTFPTLVDVIPDDLYHAMLTEHKKRFDEKTQEIRRQLFTYYDTDLRPAVRKFTVRHHIDPNIIGTRMDELRKRLSIFFDDSALLGDTNALGFTHSTGQVTVDPFRNMDVVTKPTFTHEVIHNLGGAGYRVRKDETPLDDFEKELDLPEGSGLFAVVPEKSGMHIYQKLRWFNEGVTDMISHKISPSVIDGLVGYPEEISLIQNIMKHGTKIIPANALYQAYFESYDPNFPNNEQYKNMKTLFRSISESFSPGFLIRLDRLIESYGDESSEAIPVINKHFTKIAQILMQNEPIDALIPQAKQILGTL